MFQNYSSSGKLNFSVEFNHKFLKQALCCTGLFLQFYISWHFSIFLCIDHFINLICTSDQIISNAFSSRDFGAYCSIFKKTQVYHSKLVVSFHLENVFVRFCHSPLHSMDYLYCQNSKKNCLSFNIILFFSPWTCMLFCVNINSDVLPLLLHTSALIFIYACFQVWTRHFFLFLFTLTLLYRLYWVCFLRILIRCSLF